VNDATVFGPSIRDEDDAIIWHPSEHDIARSRLRRFCEATGNVSLDDLRSWAAEDIGRYWDEVVKDLGFIWNQPYESPVTFDRGALWPTWFEGGRFNYVENALDRFAVGSSASRTAVIWEDEDGNQRSFSYQELHTEVNRFANALTSLGVRKGDRIGIFLPMVPETVIATLACSKIGAIYIPLFSGYGEDAVAARLRDCEARVLITADAFPRRGRLIPMKQVADAAMANAPSVTTCITVQRTGTDGAWTPGRDYWWHDAVADQTSTFETVNTDASDPYMIIYTSGTTGRPKGTVHAHAGFPIKSAHDLAYCFDLQPDDTLFWFTDLGWMMGPWTIAGGLMLNATLLLYEGTPDYPQPDRLWQLVEDHQVTVLGVAPTAIRALKTHGDEWPQRHDLSSLRALGSTGEMWDPESWYWLFEVIGDSKRPIINYSGGTETGGGILGCFTSEPIKSCAFSGPIPGMDADVVDETGQPVAGEVGELIIRQPWVGMTQGFWQDPERYLETYWSRFPNVWVHGDWTEVDADGYWHIRGRSDDVLKVAGKRIGPAELESAACTHSAVQESAAIGVPHELTGESVHIFAVLRPHHDPTDALAEDIRLIMRQQLGASLQPECVHFVRELPKTRNGKIMRRVIRAAYLRLPTGEITALENPAIVEEIAALGAST
jgi:acetyl-CoA synthetase